MSNTTKSDERKWTEITARKRVCIKNENAVTNLDGYYLRAPVSNSFVSLENDEQQESETTFKEKLITPPPPIFVDKIANLQPLTKLLNDTVKDDYEIKILRAEQIKIQPKSILAYTIIVKEL